jgi:hypothetical protein
MPKKFSRLTYHAKQRRSKRVGLQDKAVVSILDNGYAVKVKEEEKDTRRRGYWLFISVWENKLFVALRDEDTSEVITILPARYCKYVKKRHKEQARSYKNQIKNLFVRVFPNTHEINAAKNAKKKPTPKPTPKKHEGQNVKSNTNTSTSENTVRFKCYVDISVIKSETLSFPPRHLNIGAVPIGKFGSDPTQYTYMSDFHDWVYYRVKLIRMERFSHEEGNITIHKVRISAAGPHNSTDIYYENNLPLEA